VDPRGEKHQQEAQGVPVDMALAASLAKVDHFAGCSGSEGRDSAMFVSTEIEYLLGRSRSLFDNLQRVVNYVWSRIQLLDAEAQRIKKKQLPPESFYGRVAEVAAIRQPALDAAYTANPLRFPTAPRASRSRPRW
jgi:hypothetical protein